MQYNMYLCKTVGPVERITSQTQHQQQTKSVTFNTDIMHLFHLCVNLLTLCLECITWNRLLMYFCMWYYYSTFLTAFIFLVFK